jgi:hypothetical protein
MGNVLDHKSVEVLWNDMADRDTDHIFLVIA